MSERGQGSAPDAPSRDLAAAAAAAFDPQRMFDYPDPYPLFAAMRRHAPVLPVDLPGRRVYALTTYEESHAVLADHATYVQPSIARVVFGESRETRAARHAHARSVAARLFTAQAMIPWAAPVAATAHALLDRLEGAVQVDLMADYVRILPMIILARLIGVPPEDHLQFLRWSHDIIGIGKDPRRGTSAARALEQYLAPIVRARRADPRDDLITRLAMGTAQGHGLSDAAVLAFLRVLIPAGADPPAQALGSLLVALLSDRERFRRVGADRSLVRWALVEALRWETPIVFVIRRAARPVMIAGVEIPLASDLCVVVGSANRDERRYPDPDRFDLDRRAEDHLSFSFGRHYCMGSHLAMLIGEIGLGALLDRWPDLRLDAGVEPPAIVGFAFRQPTRILARPRG